MCQSVCLSVVCPPSNFGPLDVFESGDQFKPNTMINKSVSKQRLVSLRYKIRISITIGIVHNSLEPLGF